MVTHIYFNMFSWEKRQGWDFRDEAMRCTWAVLLMPTPFLYFTEKKTEKLLISMVSFLNKLFYYTEIEPNLAHLPFFFFNWSIVDLQCCVSFWCTAKWFIYMCVCVCVCVCRYILLHILCIMVYYRMLNMVPSATQQDLVVYLFIYRSLYLLIPKS